MNPELTVTSPTPTILTTLRQIHQRMPETKLFSERLSERLEEFADTEISDDLYARVSREIASALWDHYEGRIMQHLQRCIDGHRADGHEPEVARTPDGEKIERGGLSDDAWIEKIIKTLRECQLSDGLPE